GALQAEQGRLSGLAGKLTNASAPMADHRAELAKLQAQAAALREQTNRLASEVKKGSPASSASGGAPEFHPPEYWEQLRKAAGTKSIEARDVAMAAYLYARDHGNQAPTNLDQVASYLEKTGRSKPTTN